VDASASIETADSSATPPPRRFALEVGTYLESDRARIEQDHLVAESGLRAWITPVFENGATTYRVVLGVFSSEERAEASANVLLGRKLISEARVVPLPPQRAGR